MSEFDDTAESAAIALICPEEKHSSEQVASLFRRSRSASALSHAAVIVNAYTPPLIALTVELRRGPDIALWGEVV